MIKLICKSSKHHAMEACVISAWYSDNMRGTSSRNFTYDMSVFYLNLVHFFALET